MPNPGGGSPGNAAAGVSISATTPSTQAHGDSAAIGADGSASDALHKHGMPAAGGTAPVFGRVVRTAGNITTTSTSLVDVTGATVTFTTGAFPVQFAAAQSSDLSVVDDYWFNVDVDSGTLMFGAIGLYVHASSSIEPSSFSGQTAALSAASHTIKEQWRVGAGTATLRADSNYAHMWSAHEIK